MAARKKKSAKAKKARSATKKKTAPGASKSPGPGRKKAAAPGAAATAATTAPEPHHNGTRHGFDRRQLESSLIALPLLDRLDEVVRFATGQEVTHLEEELGPVQSVIIEVNLQYRSGREQAKQDVGKQIEEVRKRQGKPKSAALVDWRKSLDTQYLFADLHHELIRELAALNQPDRKPPGAGPGESGAIYKIWPDFTVSALISRSASTVKADAMHNAFGAQGQGIVWAVMDSGIDERHPHFSRYRTLRLDPPLHHRDFTATSDDQEGHDASALRDPAGHGTHVAGIIAGQLSAEDMPIEAVYARRSETGESKQEVDRSLEQLAGMAPRCRLLSLRVLDDKGRGKTSSLIAALQYVRRLNNYGRMRRVHGVNLSVGYEFDAEWFACGQSPLCVEVDRLVNDGVVVVTAAGNTGYGYRQSKSRGVVSAGMGLSINDPGNAAEAITVGSTHRDMPHTYGVSYFSSKGPTGDGRRKPDLLAPGERIISCASRDVDGASQDDTVARYREDSGTSMAAPHVSGVIAAFLSVRREFIGQPRRVKEIFTGTATDLGRAPDFQGSGLVDAMRAIQSV